MTREEAIKTWLPIISMSIDNMPELKEAFDMAIKALEQETKTGHWIRVTDKTGHLVWECDKCSWQQRFNTNFCPDCGCHMVEPQESEDEE